MRLGRITDRPQIALVQMLESGQPGTVRSLVQVALDFQDAGDCGARLTEELQTEAARVGRHPVHDPARARDQPVAAFLLHAGQSAQELVGDVLAQPGPAKTRAGDLEPFTTQLARPRRGLAPVLPDQLEAGNRHLVNPTEVVFQPRHLEPVAFGIDHPPPGEIVDRGAVQHGLLAAGVHRDIAANAGSVGRGRIDREHASGALGGLRHAPRHDAGLGQHGGHRTVQAGQQELLDAAAAFEFLRIEHGRKIA